MRRYIYYELIIDGYILNLKRVKKLTSTDSFAILFSIADSQFGKEISMIRSGICPFCGNSFKHISTHLKNTSGRVTNTCALSYSLMKQSIINTYMALLNRLRLKRTQNYGVVLKLATNERLKFRNRSELALYIRSNPQVINEI